MPTEWRSLARVAVWIALLAPTLQAEEPRPEPPKTPAVDRWDDPLPDPAIARLGTVRFRSHFTAQQIDLVQKDAYLLVRSRDLTLSLFEMPGGRKVNVCTPRVAGIRAIASGRNRPRLAAILTDGNVALWDVPGLKRLVTHPVKEWKPITLCFAPDESHLVVGDNEGRLHFLDAGTCQETSLISTTAGALREVACLPPSGRIAALGEAGKIAICKPDKPESVEYLQGPEGATDLAAAAQAPLLLLWESHSLQLRDTTRTEATCNIRFEEGDLTCAALAPDGKRMAAGLKDGSVVVIDDNGKRERSIAAHTGWITGLRFTQDGRTLVTSGNELAARLWDPSTGAEIDPREGHRSGVSCVAFSPDGGRIATGGPDRTIRLWDGRTFAAGRVFESAPEAVQALAWSPRGKLLAAAAGCEIALIETEGEDRPVRLVDGVGKIRSIAFSPDGAVLAAGATDTKLRIWDVRERSVLRVIAGHDQGVRAVAVTPDGRNVLSAGGHGPPRLWAMADGSESLTLADGSPDVLSVAVSPDGKHLAAGGVDRRVRVWEATSGKRVSSTAALDGPVTALSFSPDGRRIAACASRNSVHVFDALSGSEHQAFYWVGGEANGVAWTPDGKRLLSAMWDGTVLVWPVRP